MDILFYKLQDEVNDIKKTRTLTTSTGYPLTVSGTLKGATSKVAPSIEFASPITAFNGYNYCYIADFNRYYFVVDMISTRNNLTTIDLKVDVLTSFLTQNNMGNLEGYVGRCANASVYNENIPDKIVQFVGGHKVRTLEPTSITAEQGNSENVTFSFSASNNVVISTTNFADDPVLNNISVPSALQTYVGTSSIPAQYFRPIGNNYTYVTDISDYITYEEQGVSTNYYTLHDFLNYCADDQNSATFVNSVIAFPFSVEYRNVRQTVKLGSDPVTTWGGLNVTMKQATQINSGFKIIKDFRLTLPTALDSGDFLRFEPYTKVEVFIPFLSWVNIDLKDNINSRLIVYYNIDYITGKGTVFIYNKDKETLIFQSPVMIGIKIPINTTNMYENELKGQNYTRNFFTGTMTSFATGVVGAVTQNPYLLMAGITGIVTTATTTINNENLLLDRASAPSYSTDGVSGSVSGLKVKVRFTQVSVASYTTSTKSSFIKHMGVPTNKLMLLSAIPDANEYHTYCEISDLHTTSETGTYSIDDITSIEMDELKKLCASGVYL